MINIIKLCVFEKLPNKLLKGLARFYLSTHHTPRNDQKYQTLYIYYLVEEYWPCYMYQ